MIAAILVATAAMTFGCRAHRRRAVPREPAIAARPPAREPGGSPPPLRATAGGLPEGGSRLEVDPIGLTLVVPAEMAEAVYTGAALEQVRDCPAGEWDPEFGLVTNAILAFDRLQAHFGGEPFCGGVSFFDGHVRVYVLDEEVAIAAREIARRGAEAIRTVTGKEPPPPEEIDPKWRYSVPEGWTTVPLHYVRFYIDYGGFAHVDTFLRRFGDVTVAIVVWYTKSLVTAEGDKRTDPVAALLRSVRVEP